MAARETKYTANGHASASFPHKNPTSTWIYFYRQSNDQGKQLPYFYDIERTTNNEVITYHGKPNQYLWKNKTKSFPNTQAALKQVQTFIKGRKNFAGGAFIRSNQSCRFGIPSSTTSNNHLKRKVIDLSMNSDDEKVESDDDDVVFLQSSSSSSSSSSSHSLLPTSSKKKKKKTTHSFTSTTTTGSINATSNANAVLVMNSETLHAQFPFTVDLVFDANKKWADPDHQTLTKPCFKAGRNLYGHAIIIGHNPKKNIPNYWCTGTKSGIIIPYNLKLKLGMTMKGRPNHQSTESEKARVAAMFRECELRGISFKRPK